MAKEAVERRRARARRLFERLGMQSQRVSLENGTVMHCWVPPSSAATRPPLVLVHGFGWEGVTTWELQLEAFLGAEFAVYVPDLVFFGESTTTNPRRSEAFQAECVVAMLQRLGVQSGVTVVGISYGGVVAFAMASMFPSLIHKVVIVNSGVCMDAADGAAFSRKYNLPGILRDILFPNTFEEVKMAISFTYPYQQRLSDSSYQELLEVIYVKNRDARLELYNECSIATDMALSRPTLTQEVLLVWGENDRVFDIYQGLKLKKHLGNGVELVIIKDAGHIPQSEAPKAFNAAVLAFLKDGCLPQSRL